ncbi:unnamed protein product, partial [marine sediment metagenome]
MVEKIESLENPIINCSDVEEDWRNNDLALDINKESKIIKLKENKKSGLIYFEQSISSSFITKAKVKPIFINSSNLVFYFEPLNAEDETFRIIVGDGNPNIIKLQYFIDEKWLTAEERNQRKRL